MTQFNLFPLSLMSRTSALERLGAVRRARYRMSDGLAQTAPCKTSGIDMRRLFVVWNRGYKKQMVLARTASEALHYAAENGHIKNPSNYRKFLDCTDEYLKRGDLPDMLEMLAGELSGVATITDNIWHINGTPARLS